MRLWMQLVSLEASNCNTKSKSATPSQYQLTYIFVILLKKSSYSIKFKLTSEIFPLQYAMGMHQNATIHCISL